jgi:pimeloyl-ACP methyl ester carboxylesterase
MFPLEFPFIGETLQLNAETRAQLPGEFVELPDGVVHYEFGGLEGGLPVVLVHGFSVPYFIWDPTFSALAKAGFRVLRYDLYGRGYSDRPHLHYDLDLFTRQLDCLLDALGIERPVDLAGLSMGGPIAAGFAVRHPKRVRRLVLVDPVVVSLRPFPAGLKLAMIPGLGELFFSLVGTGQLLKSMAGDFFDSRQVEEFFERYRPQMAYKGFKRAILSSLRNGMLDGAPEIYEALGQQSRPVLFLWGREDRTVPFDHSQIAREAVPQAVFHAIEQAGHIPHYERAEAVNPILIDFLQLPV